MSAGPPATRAARLAGWAGRLTDIDRRGLTPFISGHVDPYDRLELDMETRLALA